MKFKINVIAMSAFLILSNIAWGDELDDARNKLESGCSQERSTLKENSDKAKSMQSTIVDLIGKAKDLGVMVRSDLDDAKSHIDSYISVANTYDFELGICLGDGLSGSLSHSVEWGSSPESHVSYLQSHSDRIGEASKKYQENIHYYNDAAKELNSAIDRVKNL